MADDYEALTDFGKIVNDLAESSDGLAASFAGVAESSKAWTIASRILSGTGLWKLQNYIRAAGNAIHMYNKNSQEQRMNNLKQIETTIKLSGAYNKLEDQIASVNKAEGTLYKAMLIRNKGNKKMAKEEALQQLYSLKHSVGERISSRVKTMRSNAVGGFADYMGETSTGGFFGGGKRRTTRTKFDADGKVQEEVEARNRGGYLGTVLGKPLKGMWKAAKLSLKFMGSKDKLNMFKSLGQTKLLKGVKFFFGGFIPMLSKLVNGLLGLLVQGMFYFVAVALGVLLLVRLFKALKLGKTLKRLNDKFAIVSTLIEGGMQLLSGLWTMLKAVFKGDLGGFWDGLVVVIKGLAKIIAAILGGIIAMYMAIYIGAINGILRFLGGKNGKIWGIGKVPQYADGGVSSGGMALVGERGPEYVTLPAGARVHSNATSRKMSQGDIHIHVNGRLGASDTELRDLATKLVKVINVKMNRSMNASVKFG